MLLSMQTVKVEIITMSNWSIESLPLEEMSLSEKLGLIEHVWESLVKHESDLSSPPWHEDILSARLKKVKEGKSEFISLEEVRKNLKSSS